MVSAVMTAGIAVPAWWPEEGASTVAPPVSPEASLALAVARGDRDAFARLVDLHKRSVYGLCLRLLGEPEEARDAAQEAFARAFTALDAYDPAQPFGPWVLRIARNHCVDLLRRRLPARQRLELDAPAGDDEPERELADPASPRADEALERAELRTAIEAAVAALPPNYREAVHLFHVEHLSYRDIAATLDVPIGTVMTWLHRARARLREALGREEVGS